jgi:hypothetical protein
MVSGRKEKEPCRNNSYLSARKGPANNVHQEVVTILNKCLRNRNPLPL